MKNQLIKITENENGQQLVSARELHEFLGNKRQFADWIKQRINKYDFIENADYSISQICEKGHRPRVEYAITIEMAKELSMVENNKKGKQARKYFIECEKIAKKMTQHKLPATYLEALKELVTSEEKRIELQEQNVVLEDENKLLTGEVLTWADRNFINAIVRKYGASRGGTFGFGVAWNDFKKELLYKYGINLNSRITYFKKTHGVKSNPKTLEMLYDDELSDAVATAIALCKDNKIEIEDIIEKFKK